MQGLVGIVRIEKELLEAQVALKKLRARADKVKVVGHREYNNGWHTALDLQNLLTVSEAIALSALQRKESRAEFIFATITRTRTNKAASSTWWSAKATTDRWK